MDINSGFARRLKSSNLLRPTAVVGYRALTALTHRSDAPRVMVNTLAKAGTHLVMSLMDAFDEYQFSGRHATFGIIDRREPGLSAAIKALQRDVTRVRPGFYMTGHLAYHDRVAELFAAESLRTIHVVRDPRALTASTGHYMRSYKRHPLHDTVMKRFPTDEELFTAVITGFEQIGGTRHWRPLSERLEGFLPWLDDPNSLVLRFEDLIGSGGGGSQQAQRATVRRIAEFLKLDLDDADIVRAADNAFDTRSATFRRAAVDGWVDSLTPAQLELLANTSSSAARALGYDLEA